MKKFFLIYFLFVSCFLLAQESYYNDVNLNLTGISLKNALANKIKVTHTNELSYSPGIWEASKITDLNPSNNTQVLLIYGWESGVDGTVTNDRERSVDNNGGSTGQWNREHVFANSLANPSLDHTGTEGVPYADAHNLRPADGQTNSSRGNKLFTTGTGNSGASGTGWYPGDEWKGDVARIVMYMYLRYDDRCLPTLVGMGDSSATPDDMIDLFLIWNAEDPVSEIERQRNAYHENTTNTYAQGNRNPFIDNPILATRIWGGPTAEDTWGIYTSSDTEAPSVPTNVVSSNITTSSAEINWDAATDNVGVTSYDVFVNGNLTASTSNTNYTITNLNSNTSYSVTVLAKDIANNASAQSLAAVFMTLVDNTAPTIPADVSISNETDSSFKITWSASTDDTAVTGYEIYIDGNLETSTLETTYTVNGLNPSTSYEVTLLAKDAANNKSALTSAIIANTTDGSVDNANELFFSEYVEGSSNNKALEIVNVTSSTIDLSNYSVKRQGNGTGDWEGTLNLTGTLASGEVLVIVNSQAEFSSSSTDPNVAIAGSYLIAQADIIVQNTAPSYGQPVNFNGDDPVGLFKNDVLIDIIGVFNSGGGNFAKDVTLRRKSSVAQPNTVFDEANEWDSFPKDTVDDIGTHSATLSNLNYTVSTTHIFPNPVVNYIYIKTDSDIKKYEVYNLIGQKVLEGKVTNEKINVQSLKKGMYILKIINNDALIKSIKFIK